MITRAYHYITLYVRCHFISMFRSVSISNFFSIAVLIRNVFYVPCTSCENVQQCADTAILTGNCSGVWDAVSLQYTCKEGSVSVHLHQQVSHTRVYVDVPCACVTHVYPFCLSLQRDTLRKWTATNYCDRRTGEPTQLPLHQNEGRLMKVKALSSSGWLCTSDFNICNNSSSD